MPSSVYTSGTSPVATGVYAKSGVELNDSLKSFAQALAGRLPFPVVITSGYRSPTAQASALQTKINLGDDLYKLYADDDIVRDVLAVRGNLSAMAAVIASYAARGRYMSDHLRGDALDFRVDGLSTAEIGQLQAGAKALGGKTLLESTPAHLHVEDIRGNYLTRAATSVAMATGTSQRTVLASGAAVAGLAIAAGIAVAIGMALAARRRA